MNQTSSRRSLTWFLQVDSGRILGPLTTDQVLIRIREGMLTGQEKIRRAPDGVWIPVSREPTFYDALLSALEEVVQPIGSKPAGLEDDEETRIAPARPPANENSFQGVPKTNTVSQNSAPVPVPPSSQQGQNNAPNVPESFLVPIQPPPKPGSQRFHNQMTVQKIPQNIPATNAPVLEQDPSESALPSVGKGRKVFRFVMGTIAVIGALMYYLGSQIEKTKKEAVQFGLMQPNPGTKTKISDAQQKKAGAEIFALFFKDTPEDYFAAQVKTIQLIEAAPNISDPRGLLCVEQLHLWPFVQQHAKDYDMIANNRRAARLLDPKGSDGLHCEVAYLMMMGRYKDAMGIIEHAASRREVPESPVLYSAKAEILAADKNFKEAIAWAIEAQKLWPSWIYPIYQQASYLTETAQLEQATVLFQHILEINPNHRAAKIQYGLLLEQFAKNTAASTQTIQQALQLRGRVPKSLLGQAYFTLAKRFAEQGDKAKALDQIKQAYYYNSVDLKIRDFLIQLGGNPNELNAGKKNNELVFMGDQYFRSGDYLFAQAEYKTAFEQDPGNAIAAMKAAKCLWKLSQANEALQWLQKAIKADPKLSIPYVLAADYYSQLFNFPAAAEVLQLGASRLNNNPEILRGYGMVELRRHNSKDAITYLEKAFKAYDNDVETLILLAQAYLMSGTGDDLQRGLNVATRAIQLEDTNPEAQVVYAKLLAQLKGVEQGINYMHDLVEKFSYTPEFRLGLAELYMAAERYNVAQIEYERVFLMDQKNKKAIMGLADCYQKQGMLEKALKKYLTAAILDPSDPEPLFKVGLVYMEAGRYKDAVTQFQRGVTLSPVYPRGYYLLGRADMAIKDYKAALTAAMQERKNNPALADSYILAGEIYMQARDYPKCANEYQQAIRYRNKGAENYVKLALCQVYAGNLDVAESMLGLAINQESGYAEIYKVQGQIYERRLDSNSAVVAYQKYLLLAPNASDTKEIEKRVIQLGGSIQ